MMHSSLLSLAIKPPLCSQTASAYQAPHLYQLVFLPNKTLPIELLIEVLRFHCHLGEQQAVSVLHKLYVGRKAVVLPALSFDVATTKIAQITAHVAANGHTLVCELGAA